MHFHEKIEEGQCYMSHHKEKIITCMTVLIAVTFTVAGFVFMKKEGKLGCCKKMGRQEE